MATFTTIRSYTFLKAWGLIFGVAVLLASMTALPVRAATTPYKAEFWRSASDSASPAFPTSAPVYTRNYDTINLNWGTYSPSDLVGRDNFLAQFTKAEIFAAGVYRFSVRADDGVRVYIDGDKVIDRWFDQAAPTVSVNRYVAAGTHTIKVEYYEHTGDAVVKFDYKPVADAGRSLWVWDKADATDGQRRLKLLDFASTHNVDRLYLQSQSLLSTDEGHWKLTTMITEASARGIEVELLFGDANWTYTANHQTALDLLTLAKQYAAGATVKPAGVHFDVEPHTLNEWKTNEAARPGLSDQYVTLLEKLRVNKGNLQLSADFAIGYKNVMLTRNGVTKELTKWVLDKVDRGYIMAYRDFAAGNNDGIIDHATFAVQYGANLGKPVGIGVETLCGLTPLKVTFCEEGNAWMEQELTKVATQYRSSGGFAGLSIHDYKGYSHLTSAE